MLATVANRNGKELLSKKKSSSSEDQKGAETKDKEKELRMSSDSLMSAPKPSSAMKAPQFENPIPDQVRNLYNNSK